jgi:hypothetical protein
MDLDAAAFESKNENSQKLLKGVEELHTYVERNQEFVPNYGERYRNGERIASGFVESAINQVVSKRMVKKQQMGWSQRGAHLLLQIRTRVLDEEWENTFQRWYPYFRPSSASQESGLTPRNLLLSRTPGEPFNRAQRNRGLFAIFSDALHYDVPAHVSSWLVSRDSEP